MPRQYLSDLEEVAYTYERVNEFILDCLVFDLVRGNPQLRLCDRQGQRIGLAHLTTPPAYSHQFTVTRGVHTAPLQRGDVGERWG